MSMAQQAAKAATLPSDHIDRVVHSVTDATKRLSQISTSTTNTTTQSSKRRSRDTIGPWKLGKTLGKGSSGRVRLAKNMETGKLAAIKIVPKTKSSRTGSLPYGIEREIIIMKLISHPNVMGLYEVWENKLELFLVLEYVDGGELFDYLVSRGRLPEKEAIHYFRQIIEGTAYCHGFNICHRDLKPENLLLDKKNKRIKIADFGMAALQTSNKLLETSCGSPHYASPEIVMGKNYNGGPSDVWSCGIILFALLTGHLPFNDDNIKRLLLKVQAGKYQMPQSVSSGAQDLISRILVVDPDKRISINEILAHPLLAKYGNKRSKSNSDLHILSNSKPQISTIKSESDVDPTILQNLQILWHGAPKESILKGLLKPELTEEKTFYSLLLAYQQRQSKQKEKLPPINAPKILQKSQFSVPSIKSQSSPRKEHVASSSRVFKSTSKKRLVMSSSKKSLISSSSRKSLGSVKSSASRKSVRLSPKKSAQPPLPSKGSLYSLHSISKRSVNLKDHLQEDNPPPLPQQSEFEMLCEEILFGAGLEGIQEEPTTDLAETPMQMPLAKKPLPVAATQHSVSKCEVEPAQKPVQKPIQKPAQKPAQQSVQKPVQKPVQKLAPQPSPAMETSGVRKSTVMPRTEKPSIPSPQGSMRASGSKLKLTPSSRDLRIASAPLSKDAVPVSLDPRRNVSQPNSIEMLLNKYSLRAHLRSKSNLKKLRNSGGWGHQAFDMEEGHSEVDLNANRTSNEANATATSDDELTNVLAQSSTIRGEECADTSIDSSTTERIDSKPRVSLPPANLNGSMTFKNLNELLVEEGSGTARAPSVVRHSMRISSKSNSRNVSRKPSAQNTQKSLMVQRPRKSSQVSGNDARSELFSDMSFALDIPTQTFTAQAIQISNGSSLDQLDHSQKKLVLLQEEQAEDDINIFEDAPSDNASVATSSSGLDSQPHVHRKATSIDSLNTTGVLTPAADVRVSLYANNMTSSAKLPRETTEEIISKFRLSPEKGVAPLHNRQSYQNARNSISQSVISMFKDLEDDHEDPNVTEHSANGADDTRGVGNSRPDGSHSIDKQTSNARPVTQKRVTMLFDDDTSNVFKSSPVKSVKNRKEVTNAQSSVATLHAPFTKSKLDTVVENEQPAIRTQLQKPLRPAPPPPAKETWFTKLIRTFTYNKGGKDSLISDHHTKLKFETVHLVMLREFGKHGIDYELKRLDKRGSHSHAEYNCWFVQGQYRFKIRIEGVTGDTIVHIKKKGKKDRAAFDKFNDNISGVLKAEEVIA